jgi:uncharacterized protein (DUF1800 family)
MGSDFSEQLLLLRYPKGHYRDGRQWEAVDVLRPMRLLNADLPDLFAYTPKDEQMPGPERARPRQETQAEILLKTVVVDSPWRHAWVGFWRDHFSVNGYDNNVGAFLPHWEHQVIERHAFGNFRVFLEATATHPSMLYYLNNRSSKAGSANENYARELFELHTMGRDAYLNHLYAQWRDVPGAAQNKPTGYIDQDVYEAARCFTGWTVEDGSHLGGGQSLPKTGRFIYLESWHDNYQKRVLAREFDPYSGAMQDGKKTLDLCAYHPATARHLMSKLVKRMVSDEPPESLIASCVKVFIENQHAPDQLMRVSDHLCDAVQKLPAAKRQKVKSPERLVASFSQAVNIPFALGEGKIMSVLETAGPPVYGWVSPEGPPDTMAWLLSAGYLRQRFSLIQGLAENWWGTGEWDPFQGLSANRSYAQLLARWDQALFGSPRLDLSQALLFSQGLQPDSVIKQPKEARRLIGLLACAPSFQTEAIAPDLNPDKKLNKQVIK